MPLIYEDEAPNNSLEGSEVRLSREGSDLVDLKFDKKTGLYWTETDQRGTFVLSVSATRFERQERPVQLPHPTTPEEFVLGMEVFHFHSPLNLDCHEVYNCSQNHSIALNNSLMQH